MQQTINLKITDMRKIFFAMLALCCPLVAGAVETFVSFTPDGGRLAVVSDGKPLDIVCDPSDYEGVRMAVTNLAGDFGRVCGTDARVEELPSGECIIVGSLQSALVRQLIRSGKIDGKELEGKTEKYLLQVVENPLPGVGRALVIAGSDKRGAIYGVYELSRQMGVSAWYWWADVPVQQHSDVYITDGVYTDGEPKVKYRGIFINDEWPCYGNWTHAKFGGFTSTMYEHVFELILRLKGNFLWPAMWSGAFYDDDPQNGVLADKMGIVMGTSHHEPMALAHTDWKRNRDGDWNYATNGEVLRRFWTRGIERSNRWERLVTVGMRGDGDEAMEGTGNIRLMETIVADQRAIIEQVTDRPAEETPQVWALYKEVQDYYDRGMQVPDDITLLLCDDNWGNVRRLPSLDAAPRKGGYGMYYHFDYVGAPRNSKWVNISPIPRVWEQMNLCYRYGVSELWIVNVGDLKPMEYPITFFLDMAWDPDRFHPSNLIDHSVDFCRSVFGADEAEEAARLLRTYAKYNRRMTPENLSSETYSMNYDEWPRVASAYAQLAADAEALAERLPTEMQDAWYQLLGYPILACSNLYDMYYAQAMNHRLARENDPDANVWADRVAQCFSRDSALAARYHAMNGGKWEHMMSQTHIGYRSWNEPEESVMPEVKRVDGTPRSTIEQLLATSRKVAEPCKASGRASLYEFAERDGCVSIEAEHFTRKTDGTQAAWTVIPEMGRTLSSITPQPVDAPVDGMALEYDFYSESDSHPSVILRFSPTLNFNVEGLRYAISIDGAEEQVVNINGSYDGELGQWQREGVIDCRTTHTALMPGKHTLRIRPLDNALVLQKIMIDFGGMRRSLLGAPETLK